MNRLALYLDLIRWNRPAGWLLLLWPTLSALWIAADGFPGWHLLVVFVLGTILMRSAGCCVSRSNARMGTQKIEAPGFHWLMTSPCGVCARPHGSPHVR